MGAVGAAGLPKAEDGRVLRLGALRPRLVNLMMRRVGLTVTPARGGHETRLLHPPLNTPRGQIAAHVSPSRLGALRPRLVNLMMRRVGRSIERQKIAQHEAAQQPAARTLEDERNHVACVRRCVEPKLPLKYETFEI